MRAREGERKKERAAGCEGTIEIYSSRTDDEITRSRVLYLTFLRL